MAMVITLGMVVPVVAAPPAPTTTIAGWVSLDLNSDGTTDYLYQATITTDKWDKVIYIYVSYVTPDGTNAGYEMFKTVSHPKNAGSLFVDDFQYWTFPMFEAVFP